MKSYNLSSTIFQGRSGLNMVIGLMLCFGLLSASVNAQSRRGEQHQPRQPQRANSDARIQGQIRHAEERPQHNFQNRTVTPRQQTIARVERPNTSPGTTIRPGNQNNADRSNTINRSNNVNNRSNSFDRSSNANNRSNNFERSGNVNRANTINRSNAVSRVSSNYRRPIYDAHNPSWRYSQMPRRNTVVVVVPVGYRTINYGGFGYRYNRGIFYRPFNNTFMIVAPPIGIFINIMPIGYRRIYVNNYPYYYYNGSYYDHRDSRYYVVSPPVGAVVESIPAGYQTVIIDGETYYTIDGAQYKPIVQDNGEIWYEVIKAN